MTQHLGESHRAAAPSVGPVGPVVLGTEFGPVSSAAERVAIRLAAQAGVPLLIVHGIDPGRLRLPGGRFAQRVDQARALARRDAAGPDGPRPPGRRRAAAPDLGRRSGDLHRRRRPGRGCIADRRRLARPRPLGRAIAGSVSATVAAQADCPVDIVRGDAPVGPLVARA